MVSSSRVKGDGLKRGERSEPPNGCPYIGGEHSLHFRKVHARHSLQFQTPQGHHVLTLHHI